MSALEVDHVTKKLEELEGLDTSDVTPEIVNIEIIRRNIQIISEITIEQLDLIESDLALYEKVSLCFLLYGYMYGEVALQKMKIALEIMNPSRNVFMLAEWVRTISRDDYMTHKWQELLIEALCVAQINHVLLKLGLDLEELKLRFLPHNPECTEMVHPVLKCLYLLCDNLTPKDSEMMIKSIDQTYLHTPGFFCPTLLELHMLSWINHTIIQIGDWQYGKPNKNMKRFSNVEAVVKYLANSKMLTNFKIALEKVVLRLNFTKNNFIAMDPCPRKEKLKQDNDNPSIESNVSGSDSTLVLPGPANKLDLAKSSSTSKLQKYEVYKETAGYILIINQREFDPNIETPKDALKPRLGTDFDRDRLVETFKRYGYCPEIRENLTDDAMLRAVSNIARKSKHMDSLIVCILSHGKLGTVFSSNNVQVSIEKIKHEMAINELKSKPKMLIIQACQEPCENNESTRKDFNIQIGKHLRAENFQNMLTTHSTIGGFVSYRDRSEGTWFIQTLCDVIVENAHEHHIGDIFTILQDKFEKKQGPAGERMVPHVSKTFSRNFYLPL